MSVWSTYYQLAARLSRRSRPVPTDPRAIGLAGFADELRGKKDQAGR